MPLRALPSGQAVRLVFPTSQVLVAGGGKPDTQAGPGTRPGGSGLLQWQLWSSGHALDTCWTGL